MIPIEQCHTASRLRCALEVMDGSSARVDLIAEAKEQLARQVVAGLQTIGLDAHLDSAEAEIHFTSSSVPSRFATRIEARWWPSTTEVVLLGGPRDGDLLVVEKRCLGDGLVLLQPSPQLDSEGDDDPLYHNKIRYVVTGWDDVNRRWVMEVER